MQDDQIARLDELLGRVEHAWTSKGALGFGWERVDRDGGVFGAHPGGPLCSATVDTRRAGDTGVGCSGYEELEG